MITEGWSYPEDNPYGECKLGDEVEIYYSMSQFLTDSELNTIWDIVGRACDRNNIDTQGDAELSIRVYNYINIDKLHPNNLHYDDSKIH